MKRKTLLKRTLACCLSVILMLTGVPLASFSGIDPANFKDFFSFEASAEIWGSLKYEVSFGRAIITGCFKSISGKLVIPATLGGYPVTSIGYGAFSDCTGLTSITIPDSVTSIGDWAFYDCTGLTSVTMGNSMTSIGYWAFDGCTGLTNITIPDSVTSIGRGAFDNTAYYNNNSNWEDDVLYIGNHLIEAKDSISGAYNIKDGTKTIAGNAFYDCTGLTSVTIPDSVTSIGEDAFEGCTGLTSITIPDSVTSIGYCAFYNTAYYNNSSNWENDVLYIGNHLIKAEDSVAGAYDIKDGTKTIAEDAFKNCTALTSVTIPDSVTSIGARAFSGCTDLTSITIPDSVASIVHGTFWNCTGLTSVTIPDSVMSIGGYAFSGCAGLTSINVSSGNTVYHSVDNCLIKTKSKTLILGCKNSIIPSDGSVTSIGYEAFYNCSGLTSITIPDSVTSIGGRAFNGCTGLTRVIIPDSVTSIGGGAFSSCAGLTSITIPDSVTSIGDWAFYYCTSLTYVTIPASVTDIDDEAFGYYFDESTYEVKKLENFTIYGYRNTAAETYANDNGFAFIALDEEHTHTFGDWVITKEATVFESGERKRTCTVCGFSETEEIERLNVAEVKDEKTGISVVYPENSYEGEVEISVTQTFDGASYYVLNAEKGNYQKALFDITTLVDGQKVQPNGSVFVKIPLPSGYSAEKTVVYYITNDGRLEKMESRVEDGYVVFETTHFSFYAIVDETEPENPSENCSCACHKKGIINFFYKIILFFQKIFRKNKVCKCGVYHY